MMHQIKDTVMGRNLRLQGDGLCQDEDSDIAENCEERGTSESQSLWKPLTQIFLMEMVTWPSAEYLR